jgi:hypothetical protein
MLLRAFTKIRHFEDALYLCILYTERNPLANGHTLMETSLVLNRCHQAASSLPKKALIEISCEGNMVFLQTGESTIQRSRLRVRLGGVLGLFAGLALTLFSPWGWAVSVVSLLVLIASPRFFSSQRLLAIDTAGERLILLQKTGADVASLCLDQIRGLHGVYETKGWDPYSVLYAEMQDGSHVPILLLLGGSEPMATEACRLLGSLLDCPATYTGAFGNLLSCYPSPSVSSSSRRESA